MRSLGGALAAVLVAVPAYAFTQAQVERAAAHAHNGLRTVVGRLAATKLGGRDNDTPQSAIAQRYLVRKLRRLGVGLNGRTRDDAAYRQPFTYLGQTGTNLVAVIPGRELPDEYVMVGAHYDHLGTRSDATGACSASGDPGHEVCNGAADNASGVAATLAIGTALRALGPPRRSVILALWDAEEDLLNGSGWYATHPLVPNAAVKGYVNFDIQGADLLPSLKNVSFAVGAETGGAAFQALVADAIRPEGLDTQLLSFIFGQYRSDYVNIALAGIPTVFFTDANNGCYHTVHDDPETVDWKKLRRQAHVAFRTVAALTDADTPPPYVAPTAPTFADAQGIAAVVARAQADLALLTPADQTLLTAANTALQDLVAAGPAAFDAGAGTTLVLRAVDLVNALRHVKCRRF